jgi:tetratricopeptide (TPR) repeat protein
MSERLQAIHQTLAGSAAPATPAPKTIVPAASTSVISKTHLQRTATPTVPKDSKDLRAIAPVLDTSNSGNDHSTADTKELLKQAVTAHSKGDLSEATRLFEQVLSIDSKNTDANYNLGSMAEDKGDLDAALHFYRDAAASSPEDSDIRKAVASVERRVAKRQESADNAEFQELAKAAGTAFKQGDYDEAISKLEALAQKAPSDASVQFGLSRAWYRKGDLGRSKQYLQGAIALAPDQQVYKNVLQHLDKEIQTKPNDPSILGNSDGSDFTTPNRVASQPPANGDASGIVPYTDQGLPQPMAGSVAMARSAVLPVGASLTPYANQGYMVNPFDQAILGAMTGMSALSNTSAAYQAYGATPYARPSRMRLGRTGGLGGLLGLLGVGY